MDGKRAPNSGQVVGDHGAPLAKRLWDSVCCLLFLSIRSQLREFGGSYWNSDFTLTYGEVIHGNNRSWIKNGPVFFVHISPVIVISLSKLSMKMSRLKWPVRSQSEGVFQDKHRLLHFHAKTWLRKMSKGISIIFG
jgi:hypothetical protein